MGAAKEAVWEDTAVWSLQGALQQDFCSWNKLFTDSLPRAKPLSCVETKVGGHLFKAHSLFRLLYVLYLVKYLHPGSSIPTASLKLKLFQHPPTNFCLSQEFSGYSCALLERKNEKLTFIIRGGE